MVCLKIPVHLMPANKKCITENIGQKESDLALFLISKVFSAPKSLQRGTLVLKP